VTFARAIKLPDESREAITVAPYLNCSLPPDSTIEKLVVTKLVADDAVAELPVHEPDEPVVFWLSVGNVQFVRVPEDGVPSAGVTNVGLFDNTVLPVPVEVVTPVPPEATARVADKPAAVPVVFWFNVGNVQFVKVPEDGVPSAPPTVT
jgi:hypothetical protein